MLLTLSHVSGQFMYYVLFPLHSLFWTSESVLRANKGIPRFSKTEHRICLSFLYILLDFIFQILVNIQVFT